LENTVGNRDPASGQVGLGAPSGPGWYGAVVAVEVGFDVEGVVAPHGPACGSARRRPDPLDEVTGRVLGEGGDPGRAGAVQGSIDLGEGSAELLALGDHIGDVVLVLGEGGKTLP
jgi:hypothetical protein